MEGDVIQTQTLFEFLRTGTDPDGTVRGELHATGLRPKFLEVLRVSGIVIPADSFDPKKV
jgi:pilus assembly protein CpaF